MNGLREEIKRRIAASDMIPAGGHVVCGVSGGPDSLCMLHILDSLKDDLDYSISVVHVNHLYRADKSDADEWFMEKLCEEMGLSLISKRVNIAEIARDTGQTFEEAGREARYEVFNAAALGETKKRIINSDMIRIAVAHNRNDQTETILMRLIRGTGPDGLAGMEADRFTESGFPIIRPLLGIERSEIEDYCALCGLFPRIDKTNMERIAMRNKMRLDLIPLICEKYNPSFEEALIRLGSIAADDKAYFDKEIAKILDAHDNGITPHDDGRRSLPLGVLKGAELPIRRRLIMNVFKQLGLIQDIEYSHLGAADNLILSGATGRGTDFPGGYRLEIEYENVVFHAPEIHESGIVGSFAVAISDLQRGGSGMTIFEDSPMPVFAEILGDPQNIMVANTDQLLLDFDALAADNKLLSLRGRTTGDRISPIGMTGSSKIQDIFVDKKIPRRERDRIPLIATENEVLWIIGVRRTRLYPVSSATKHILRLTQK